MTSKSLSLLSKLWILNLMIWLSESFWKSINTLNLCDMLNCFSQFCATWRAGWRKIEKPNLKFWIPKWCYQWCGFSQRCKTSLSKIPLDQIFMSPMLTHAPAIFAPKRKHLLKEFLSYLLFWKIYECKLWLTTHIWTSYLIPKA